MATVGLGVLAACSDTATRVTRPREPANLIVDGRHASGNPHFYFLPPMVADPGATGVFDAAASPVVEICELRAGACVLPLVARFSMTEGPDRERVRLMPAREAYEVRWKRRDDRRDDDHRSPRQADDDAERESGRVYRISVLVNEYRLGIADVREVEDAHRMRNVRTGEFITLADDRSLRIRFRIEQGIFPLQLEKLGGDGQQGLPGYLSDPVRVRVTDAGGYPAEGLPVAFYVAAGGSVAPTSVTTDVNGIGATRWTLGPAAGTQSMSASLSGTGITTTFTALAQDDGPLGLGGEWRGTLSGSAYSLQIWSVGSQTFAAIEFVDRPREHLRIMGIANGPPQTLYLYRGLDDAMIGLYRDAQGQVVLEYWEDQGCARTSLPTRASTTVPSTNPGADLSTIPQDDYVGTWTGVLSGNPFSLVIQGAGSALTATGDFGLGVEALVPLGFSGGTARVLYLWRPADHATITVQLDGAGQTVAWYWENVCARYSVLVHP